jgi:hypothetical protein
MPGDLRFSSLPEVPVLPLRLRRFQWIGLCCQTAAVVLMFCHLSFQYGYGVRWYYPVIIALELVFMVAQIPVIRWSRQQNNER